VQVDPIKPTFTAPGTRRLKLRYNKLPTILLQFCFNFAFNINLRRCIKVSGAVALTLGRGGCVGELDRIFDAPDLPIAAVVWRCSLSVSKPVLKLVRANSISA